MSGDSTRVQNGPDPLGVAIVEDLADIREGIGDLLDATDGFRCVGRYGSMEQALARFALRAAVYSSDLEALKAGGLEGRYALDPVRVQYDLLAEARFPARVDALARLSFHDRPSYDEGVLLLDARLAYDLLEGDILEVFFEGDNLGDVSYEELPGVPLPGRRLATGLRLTW